MWRDYLQRIPRNSVFSGSEGLDHAQGLKHAEWLDHAEGRPGRFVIASGGALSEGYGHGGSGVCLGDGQSEAYL